MRTNPIERFWAKVEPRASGCWEWTAARVYDRQGRATYGSFNDGEKNRSTHRFIWETMYGPVPDGLMVMHTCDNPPCVRPSHLALGTHGQNMAQMVARRRFAHGLRHHSNRLTEQDVRAIKRRLAAGEPVRVIADDYPIVGYTAIFLIATGKNWKYLDAA